MDLQQLDQILTLLCVEIKSWANITARYEISNGSEWVYASLYFGDEYSPIHSIDIIKGYNYKHIYWSIAFKCIKEDHLPLHKVEEIYKQFNNIEA